MLTPLFPEDDYPIYIEQGKTGDCYLLTFLDCIFNSKDGYAHIKSMFHETVNGIEVRVKQNEQSKHLRKDSVRRKYKHHYDFDRHEDVFF